MQALGLSVESVVSFTAAAAGAIVVKSASNRSRRMFDAHPSEPSDVELAARMAQRDRAAFEQLYDRYAGKAFGLVLRLINDRTVAEEVLQESFWRAWQRASTFDANRASFGSWLMSIAHHSAIDELRRQRSRTHPGTVELDAPEDGESREVADPQMDVTESAWANMVSDHVRTAMTQLPEAQRTVIELAYFGGFTRQEIAAQLQEPLGTVHTRARLGLIKLKELLATLNG